MHPFDYTRAATPAEALAGLGPGAALLAGGTELLNWMRLGVVAPERIVDIGRIPGLDRVEPLAGGGVTIGALGKLNDVAQHPAIARGYPVLSQAILKAASAQIRNLASIGGNLMQRTRCPYFRAEERLPCNKREAGSGCAARHGVNDRHAIFGWTDDCVATQPSDPAVALAALDAMVVVEGRSGRRRIPLADFHVLPAVRAEAHTVLAADEIILAIELPAPAPRSAYVKVRERESYEYATVSAAATVEIDGGRIRAARIALGSVAMKPWRLPEAERRLVGLRPGSDEARAAIVAGFADARALPDNAFKIPLAQNAAHRALRNAGEVTP